MVELFEINKNNVYSRDDYKHKIELSMIHNTYLETTNNNKELPNSDSVHRLIHTLSIKAIREQIHKQSYRILKKLKQRYILIFDSTNEPFYGSKKGMYTNEYKNNVKGATGSFKYLACFLLTEDNQKFFIDVVPLSVFDNEKKEVLNILQNVLNTAKRKPDIILLDRGYYSADLVKGLHERRLKYLMFVPKRPEIRKYIEENKHKGFMFMSVYTIRNVNTPVVYINERVDIDKVNEWVFFTNVHRRELYDYVHLYRLRWNIETAFRVHDESRIKTKSLDIVVRYFFFVYGMIMYNLWKKSKTRISFKRFLLSGYEDSVMNRYYWSGFLSCLLLFGSFVE